MLAVTFSFSSPLQANSSEVRDPLYPNFGSTYKPPVPTEAELGGLVTVSRGSGSNASSGVWVPGGLNNPNQISTSSKIFVSPTRLIVKISISLGETSTVTSETSTVKGEVNNRNAIQIQLNKVTDLLAKKHRASERVSLTKLRDKNFVYERWVFSSEKELAVANKLIAKERGILGTWQDYSMQPTATPNDPDYGKLWGMASIKAPAAWNTTKGSKSVIVAVIDTGIDLDHPDLVNNLWTNPGEVRGDGIDNDGNGYIDDVHGWDFVQGDGNPNDDVGSGSGSAGHGTHVAGTIAAEGNNSVGVAGVNWKASLMALRICGSYGCYLSDFWAALNYAYNHGAQVANASFGGQYNPFQEEEDYIAGVANPGSSPLQKGVLVVAAAGNAASNNDQINFCPACYQLPNLISVAATNSSNDSLASFSNYGSRKVAIAAPGDSIYSTLPPGAFGYTGYYGTLSGTSMAAPHVTGVASLFLSKNLTWTPTALKKALIKSARRTPSLSGRVLSGGVVDAQEILNVTTEPNPFVFVDVKGTGSGQIVIGSQSCTSDCLLDIAENTAFVISAAAASGSTIGKWDGDCSGSSTGSNCSLTQSSSGRSISIVFNGPPLVTHTQTKLSSSESIDVWDDGTYKNYFGNFVSTSLSADGSTRARSIFRFPSGGWCSYASSETGGITVRDETSNVERKSWTAPYVGSDSPYGRWSNCGSFGKKLQLSADGNYLMTTIDPHVWIKDWDDPTQDFFSCGSILYKKGSDGSWGNGVALTPVNRSDCFAATKRSTTGWSGMSNWHGAIMSPDHTKIFISGYKKIYVLSLSGDTISSRDVISLSDSCQVWNNLSSDSTGTKLLIPTYGCSPMSNALLYTKGSSGWVLTKRFMDTSSYVYGTTATLLSLNGETLALSYSNETGSGVLVYEREGSSWALVKNFNTLNKFLDFTTCKFISANNGRIVCSSANADVGNNPRQGVIIVYDRNGNTWRNTPYISILWDTNGQPLEQMSFQSATADGTLIDAGIGGLAIGADGFDQTFMGLTFELSLDAPNNLTEPEISGSPKVGSSLITSNGTWSGTPPPNFSYSWYSCNSLSESPTTSCNIIGGATASTLEVNSSLINRYVRAAVTATNGSGSEKVYTVAKGPIGSAPSVSGNSSITGNPIVGNSIQTLQPFWAGTPVPTYSYAWYRCDNESSKTQGELPSNCFIVSEAVDKSYTISSSDYLKYLLIKITGANTHGNVSIWTPSTKQILAGPTNITLPTLSGTAAVGQTLSATKGSWSGSPAPKLTYQWLSCTNNSSTDSCTDIAGAKSTTLRLLVAQAGLYLRVRENATNTIATTSTYSIPTAAIGSPPIASGTLTQSGTASVGSTLTLTDGLTWVGYPTPSVSTQWYRCTARVSAQSKIVPTTCSSISGATSSSYQLTSNDAGKFITTARIANLTTGPVYAIAPSTTTAIGQAPTNSAAPTVSGTAAVGQTLSATTGTWSGSPAPKLTYQWLSCTNNSSTDSCTPITGATRNTFKLLTAQAATYIRARVTATNSITATNAFSTATAKVPG